MNKGFLTFTQEEGLTMLKDEPEDLTHLAPTAGDACILLENDPFNMFEEFMMNDNYCSLLGDDLANGSPVDSLTADSLLMSSPEPQETDSSCEQSSLLTELSLDAFESARSDHDIDDGNSPFIPSSDELPVLESAVMWGALPDNVSLARPQPSESQNSSPAPALQRLLVAPTTGPPPQDLITNIYSDQGLIPSRGVSSWETGVKRIKKREEEPSAKRVKRSPSPAQTTIPTSASSSSVLMNLLDIIPQQSSQHDYVKLLPNFPHKNYPRKLSQQSPVNLPVPVIKLIKEAMPKNMLRIAPGTGNPIIRANVATNAMSPLSLNVGSPMYSLPASPNTPNYSPAMSPAQRDRVLLSPYSTPQSLSPASTYSQVYSPNNRLLSPVSAMQGGDPYLSNKMQASPSYRINSPVDLLLDSNMASPDFWNASDMLQGSTSDLLTAFDDVKLD